MHPRIRALLSLTALLTTLGGTPARAQEQTARLVRDINRTPGGFHSDIKWMTPFGSGIVFAMDTLALGSELWTSDGTPEGTRLLKDVLPGPGSSQPDSMTLFDYGQKIAFRSPRLQSGHEVWVTDGTEAGTVQIFKAPASGDYAEIYIQAGTTRGVFFNLQNRNVDDISELLFSDGTTGGTWALNPVEGETRAHFSNPTGYITSGPWCYFIANGSEIWRSDGSEAGTTRLITLTHGLPNRLALANRHLLVEVAVASDTSELWACPMDGGELMRLNAEEDNGRAWFFSTTTLGDELIFIRRNEYDSSELWATDGSAAGTRRIPLLPQGLGSESPPYHSLTPWKGAVYFVASGHDGGDELWRTDGTPSGTIRLAFFPIKQGHLTFFRPVATEDALYFHVIDPKGRPSLWRTKGDIASTRLVKRSPQPTGYPSESLIRAMKSDLFFTDDQDGSLWRGRGKSGGAIRLTRPEKTTASGVPPFLLGLPYEMLGGSLLEFVDTGSGNELWRMNPDGSRARAIWKTTQPLQEDGRLDFRGKTEHGALFTFKDGSGKHQVWVTDGTRPGTRLLGNHGPAADQGDPQDFARIGDVWFYSVVQLGDPSYSSLWKTDGTPAGTSEVRAADGTSPGLDASEMVVFRDHLYFLSSRLYQSTTLWRSDGTTEGTVSLKGWHGQTRLPVSSLSSVGDELLFLVNTNYLNGTLWRSDGTTGGTTEASPSASFRSLQFIPAVDLDGMPILQGHTSDPSGHWWRYDSSGITRLANEEGGRFFPDGYRNTKKYAVAGRQLFYCGTGNAGIELWATDGTPVGTRQVKDISPPMMDSVPDQMLAVGDEIYFTAYDPDHGRELWRSDGTEAGTTLVADIEPGPGDSHPAALKLMNGKLYFTAYRRDVGYELFSIDLPTE